MTEQKCAACNSRNVERTDLRRGLAYMCCKDCGHCAQVIEVGNSALSFDEAQKKYYGQHSPLLSTEPGLFEHEALSNRHIAIRRLLQSPSKVLEVGPGGGHLLGWLLSEGHTATAVEHSPVLARQLSERFSTRVLSGEFETLEFEPGSYDAVCSFHVIEHVSDPSAHLSKAFELVRPGGLAFIATPNARSWEQIVFRSLSPNFDSAHLVVFSPSSLRILSEKAGWTVLATSTPESTSGWVRVLTKAIRRLKKEDEEVTAGKYAQASSPAIRATASILKAVTSPIRALQQKMGYGNEIFVVLQKPLQVDPAKEVIEGFSAPGDR